MKKHWSWIFIFVVLVSACRQPAGPGSRYSEAITESHRLIDSLLKTGRTPGIDVAVSLHGEVVWSEGFGYADLEHQVPVIPGQTRFRIGSVSKPLTAAAVGRLLDRGMIDLKAPVQKYVPYFPEKAFPLTVEQIGSHTGGIRHYRGNEFMLAKRFGTVEDGVAIFKDDPLEFEPGTRFSYSSYTFNLLSAAVEGASGMDFLSLMQKEVFDPLGMTSTCADKNDSIILNRASFYAMKDSMLFVNAPYVDNSYKWAGGGFISTTTDLVKFGEAHMKPGYLSQETLGALTTPQVLVSGDTTEYGIGWFCGTNGNLQRISHGGGSIGGITDFVVYPDEELVIVLLSNSSDTRYGNVVSRIAGLFLEADEK